MPRDVYTPLSLMRVVDIDAIAEWLERVRAREASDKPRDSVVPIDDFEA